MQITQKCSLNNRKKYLTGINAHARVMSTARDAETLFGQQLEHCRALSEQHPRGNPYFHSSGQLSVYLSPDDLVSKALGSAEKAVAQLTRYKSWIFQSANTFTLSVSCCKGVIQVLIWSQVLLKKHFRYTLR